MRKRSAALWLILGVLSSSCAIRLEPAKPPWCLDGTLILEAQSVPGAEMIPCLESMPLGWEFSSGTIGDEGSVFTLDSDIAGREAVTIEFTDSCDVDGFVRVPSDEVGAERYEFVDTVVGGFRAHRAYVFEGGCALLHFRFDAGAPTALANEVSLAVAFVPRAALNEAVREVTDGREQLDPSGGR
jgi:hypothetical protein